MVYIQIFEILLINNILNKSLLTKQYIILEFISYFLFKMITWLMPFFAILNVIINISAIVCVFLYPPQPFALFGFAFFTLCLMVYVELFKRNMLLEKRQVMFMTIFGIFIVLSVYYLSIGLTLLIYLQQVQSKNILINTSFDQLMWQQSKLDQTDISILSIGFYIGNCITISFYTRQYYRMFWVNQIIHIYRYLKSKIHHLNQSLLSHLPLIKVTRQLKKDHCVLCLQNYEYEQKLTKLSCGHIFHRDCIRLWVVRSNACPLCRKRVIYH